MDKRSSMKRLLSAVLVLAMVLSLAVPVLAAPAEDMNFRKVDNIFEPQLSGQQQTQQVVVLDERDPEEMVRVSIVLEENSTISAGYAPIGIASNSDAMAYRDNLKVVQEEMTATIESVTGSELDVVWNLTLAANIISANVKYGQIETIRAIPGVVDVFEETIYSVPETLPDSADMISPNMAQSKSQIGSETAWNAGYTGAGMRIAIIDNGLDALHVSFNEDAFEYALGQLGGSYDLLTVSEIQQVLTRLNAYESTHCSASDLYYSSKVPFGFNYREKNLNYAHLTDSYHGSHVAGISAANKYLKNGNEYVHSSVACYGIQGVAPDAQIVALNVFGTSSTCSDADCIAAIEDALLLGCDAVNMSLGGICNHASPYNTTYENILNQLINSGVVLAIAASNSGHWYQNAINSVPYLYLDDVSTHTAGSPGTYTNSLCVASVDSADAATAEYYEMSSFSSWGIPGSLTMKPEISAPGGGIWSVAGYAPGEIDGHNLYSKTSGTSMASPQVAGMAALVLQHIRKNNLDGKTGLDARVLSHSLLMSTAEPMRDSDGLYYPILQQGAGMGNIGNAVSADSFLLMGEDATASWADGKVKAELGDDPDRTGSYTFRFTIHNITSSAKTYQLSADVFTQGIHKQNDILYMDLSTDDLDANITWELPGNGGGEAIRDFNGNGTVDEYDGQHLLRYLVGNVQTLYHEDQADISGDGRITSYDAYLFFTDTVGTLSGESVEVPGNGSVEVEVTITLTDAQKAQLDQYYTNGAYIQAYVYAESGTTSHSIPVLGFYGNWTDPSMFDKGSAMEYLHGEETRVPYVSSDPSSVNTVTASRDGSAPYHLGGNPVVQDAQYMPERNAINNQTTTIDSAGWTLIRNAGEIYAVIRNTANNTYITKTYLRKAVRGAFDQGGGEWFDGWYEARSRWDISGIPENTPLEVGVVAIPEYYTLREDYSFDAVVDELGDGAFMTVPVVIDNTVPTMNGYALLDNNQTLRVNATDNQYVAAVRLVSTTGTVLAQAGSRSDARKGQALDFDLDVSAVSGSRFYIQVYDYAGNMTTFVMNETIGSVTERVTGISIVDSTDRLLLGKMYPFAADVQPENLSNRSVSWSSSDRSVATVDQTGEVIAVGVGTCTITATSVLDPSFKASCELTVYEGGTTLSGLLWDNCDNSVIYDWDLDAGNGWTTRVEGPMNKRYTSATQVPGTNRIFACDYLEYRLCEINAATGQIVGTSGALSINGTSLPALDIGYSSVFSTTSNPMLYGVYADTRLFYKLAFTGTSFSFVDCASLMNDETGNRFMAVTSLGVERYQGEITEHLVAVDNVGCIWDFWVSTTSSSVWYAYTASNLVSAGAVKNLVRDGKGNIHSCNSLYADEDGTLYLGCLNVEERYGNQYAGTKVFSLEYTGNTYYIRYEGYSGDGIWPVAITAVSDGAGTNSVNASREWPEAQAMLRTETMQLNKTAEPAPANTIQLTKPAEPAQTAPAAQPQEAEPMMIRNFAGETVRADAQPQAEEDIVIDVYAKDAGGNPVARTNGMFLVEYDPAQVEMDLSESMLYGMKYGALNTSESGVMQFAFVSTRGLTATDLMTRLVFKNNATQATTIRITHCDYNDAQSGYVETFTVEPQVQHVRWVQASLSLEGNIGINFYVELSDFLVNNAGTVMRFTMNGETMDVPLADAQFRGGQYIFTCPVNAKNMADEVTAQVYAGDEAVGKTASMSVRRYATYMVSAGNDTMKKLMKAMLNYGAVAQQTFNHNVGDLANKDLSAADKVLAEVDASPYAHSVAGSERGIRASGITLVLETETAIRVLFTLDGTKAIDQYTFRVDGEVVQPQVWSGNVYFIEIPNIAAQDLDVIHWVQVGGITVRYGGLSYVNQINNLASATQLQKDMAKALFAYWNAAENYFNSL